MSKRMPEIFLMLAATCFIYSCSSYTIPLSSFVQQFENIDSTKLKPVKIKGAVKGSYYANPITKIECLDKKGNAAVLDNSPSIEIRFTYGEKKKRTVFYFDRTMILRNSVVGAQSRIITALKAIPLDSITKIEIQDGKKNFSYVQ